MRNGEGLLTGGATVTSARAERWNSGRERLFRRMAADPRDTDPIDQDPREHGLERRSSGPALSPWLMIGAIVLLAAAVYVVSALL